MIQKAVTPTVAARARPENEPIEEEYGLDRSQDRYFGDFPGPWKVRPPTTGPVREFNKTKDPTRSLGSQEDYEPWRRQMIAAVHSKKMPISKKCIAITAQMDPKTQELKHIMSVIKYNASSYKLFIELLENEYAG
jgi:hypothetical protein